MGNLNKITSSVYVSKKKANWKCKEQQQKTKNLFFNNIEEEQCWRISSIMLNIYIYKIGICIRNVVDDKKHKRIEKGLLLLKLFQEQKKNISITIAK